MDEKFLAHFDFLLLIIDICRQFERFILWMMGEINAIKNLFRF